jgi:phosphate transport system protein
MPMRIFGRRDSAGESDSVISDDVRQRTVRLFALVGETISAATLALLGGDREAGKMAVARDEEIDRLARELISEVQQLLLHDPAPSVLDREALLTLLRILPEVERNGDLAEHIARRAVRGLGAEMSPRSRGLIERMGEVAATIEKGIGGGAPDGRPEATSEIEDTDDEMDELHVALTAELVSGSMSVPVAVEVAMIGRFYERFGDHCVNLARRRLNASAD